MVKGLRSLEQKFKTKIPIAVRRHLKQALAVFADKIVASAEAFVPEKSGALKNSIGWVWGSDAPEGSISIGTVSSGADKDLMITVFAGDKAAFYARWVEFGTSPHSVAKGGGTKAGKAAFSSGGGKRHSGARAQPFFFPAYRLQKRGGKARITRAVKKGLKEGSR